MADMLEIILVEVSEILMKPNVFENVQVLLEQNLEVRMTHVSFNRGAFTIHITPTSISIKSPILISPISHTSFPPSSPDSFSLSYSILDSEFSDNFRNSIPQSVPKFLINFTHTNK